jgi:lysophospholipase L1-like esterase
MNRILIAAVTSFSLAVSAFSEIPKEATWPVPSVPPGKNPAAFSVPRQDWLQRVQWVESQTRGKQYDLIFDGDSITDFWRNGGKTIWDQHFAALRSVNLGIGGDKTEHLLWRLQQGLVDAMDPKLVVLMIGTNNTGRDDANQIAEGIKAVTTEYLKRCPHTHVLLLGVFPRAEKATDPVRAKIIDINKKIAALESSRVTYMDIGRNFLDANGTITDEIMPDKLHPTTKGYVIWANAIQPVVDKYVPKAPATSANVK